MTFPVCSRAQPRASLVDRHHRSAPALPGLVWSVSTFLESSPNITLIFITCQENRRTVENKSVCEEPPSSPYSHGQTDGPNQSRLVLPHKLERYRSEWTVDNPLPSALQSQFSESFANNVFSINFILKIKKRIIDMKAEVQSLKDYLNLS